MPPRVREDLMESARINAARGHHHTATLQRALAAQMPATGGAKRVQPPPTEIQKYEAMAADNGLSPDLRASARRVVAQLRRQQAVTDLEAMKTAATMRRYAESPDPRVRLAGIDWLGRRGLLTTARPASEAAVRTSNRIIEGASKITAKARREGWPDGRRRAEIQKLVDGEIQKLTRSRTR